MSVLKARHDAIRATNGGKLTQSLINADRLRRGLPVTRKMYDIAARELYLSLIHI